jgi:hypothetical protein
MVEDAPPPTLVQFKDACRREFAFFRELGYSELEADSVARGWRRAADPQYRQSLQKRRLP